MFSWRGGSLPMRTPRAPATSDGADELGRVTSRESWSQQARPGREDGGVEGTGGALGLPAARYGRRPEP